MKRLSGIFLCLILILSLLAACGGDPVLAPVGDQNSGFPGKDHDSAATTTPETIPSPAESTDVPTTEPASPSGEPAGAGELVAGVWTDNVYYSVYADLTYEMPEDWISYDSDELASLVGQTAGIIGQDTVDIAQMITIYEIMAADVLSGRNVMIMYENLAVSGGLSYTTEEYGQVLISQLESYGSALGSYEFDPFYEIEIGAEKYIALAAHNSSGIDQLYLMRNIDDYMLCIVLSAEQGYDFNEMLDCFS